MILKVKQWRNYMMYPEFIQVVYTWKDLWAGAMLSPGDLADPGFRAGHMRRVRDKLIKMNKERDDGTDV